MEHLVISSQGPFDLNTLQNVYYEKLYRFTEFARAYGTILKGY